MNDECISVGTVAPRLGVSDDTVRRWAAAGLLPFYRLPSGHLRFRSDEVERFRERLVAGLAGEGKSE